MRYFRIAIIVFALFALQGCVAAAVTFAGLASAAGIDYTMNAIAYKTFTEPMDEVQSAIIETLEDMDFAILDTRETDDGWAFTAGAKDRTIEIDLEALTSKTTRIRVVANEGEIFFKDSATADEIIVQTAANLEK